MRDASTPELKLAAGTFHLHSFVVFYIFFLCGDLKFWLNIFYQTSLMNKDTSYFLKVDQTKMFQILLYILSNFFDSANLIKLIWSYISSDSWLG